jgi:hypothetical protein
MFEPHCSGEFIVVTSPVLTQLPSNEHLDYVATLLDDMWHVPGTRIRFGLDALIGWIPKMGDVMAP